MSEPKIAIFRSLSSSFAKFNEGSCWPRDFCELSRVACALFRSLARWPPVSRSETCVELFEFSFRPFCPQAQQFTSLRASFERAPNRSNRDPNPNTLWVSSHPHKKAVFFARSWHNSAPITRVFLCCRL